MICPTSYAFKRAINLPISIRPVELPKELGMNLSEAADTFLATEFQRRDWYRWSENNKVSMDAYKQRIASKKRPLAKYRSF